MGGAFQALANSRAAREGQSRDSGHPVWGSVVRARAAAAKADREARSQEREAEAVARTSMSDLAELKAGRLHLTPGLFELHCPECRAPYPCKTVRLLADRYRDRPGFEDHWWTP